jgi:hypothetical protein
MGYSIHIERPDSVGGAQVPITLEEWRRAVAATPGMRLAVGNATFHDPVTREEIRLPNSGGDAEVFFPKESSWRRVFTWSSGRVSFGAVPQTSPVWQAARSLAGELRAKLVGDEGEPY